MVLYGALFAIQFVFFRDRNGPNHVSCQDEGFSSVSYSHFTCNQSTLFLL